MRVAVRCGLLIPGRERPVLKDCAVLIEGQRITAVSEEGRAEALIRGTEGLDQVVDAGSLTVLPGLIDSHDHLGLDLGDDEAQVLQPDAYVAVRAVRNARTMLRAGITLMRDLGEKNHVDFPLRQAIEEGLMAGPTVLVSGMPISRTGGHGHMGLEADGVDEVRKAARQQLKAGADIIKIMVTGGISTRGSSPLYADYRLEEIRAAVEEAEARGKTTSAHAYGGPGAEWAIEAGVTSLEHGSFLDRRLLELMAKRGTFLVTTMGGIIGGARGKHQVPDFMLPKLQRAAEVYLQTVSNAREAGVSVCPGTDENHGQIPTELEYLMECGFSRMQAVCATTSLAARLCALEGEVGSVDAGKYADLIAVQGSPLEEIGALRRVVKVVKRGRLVVDGGRIIEES